MKRRRNQTRNIGTEKSKQINANSGKVGEVTSVVSQEDNQKKYEQEEAIILSTLLEHRNLDDSELCKKLEDDENLFKVFIRFQEEFPYLTLKEPDLRKWSIRILTELRDEYGKSAAIVHKIVGSIIEEDDDYPNTTDFRDFSTIYPKIRQIRKMADIRAFPILRNFVLELNHSQWHNENDELIDEYTIRWEALETLKKLKYYKLLETALKVFENDPLYSLKDEAIRIISELKGTVDMEKLWEHSRKQEQDYLEYEMIELALNSQEFKAAKILLYYGSIKLPRVKEKILTFNKKKLEDLLIDLLYSDEFYYKEEIYNFLIEIKGNEAVPILIKHLDESEHHFCTDEHSILIESLIKTGYESVFPDLFKCFRPKLGEATIGNWEWMDYDFLFDKIEEIADKKIVEAFESENIDMVEGVLNYLRNKPDRKWLENIQEKTEDEKETVRISAIYALESLSE